MTEGEEEEGSGYEPAEQLQNFESDELGLLESVLADRYQKEIVLEYRDLFLRRLNTYRNLWSVFNRETGEKIDTVNVSAAPSTAALRRALKELDAHQNLDEADDELDNSLEEASWRAYR